ncbi:MAG TPA: hypothetical protein LFV92_07900 [Rickettsia endosymbiont of Ceroptres masudai]|nr:hypothetical protein [Rickettsia endosymbiont of Ceroptres masudai]
MPRTFIYARVSKIGQTPENQIKEIKTSGFNTESHRIITETISGSVPPYSEDITLILYQFLSVALYHFTSVANIKGFHCFITLLNCH